MKLHTYTTNPPLPSLAGSQALWPWLEPPRGHGRHFATGSKTGSIRILSIIGIVSSACFKSLVQPRSLLACP